MKKNEKAIKTNCWNGKFHAEKAPSLTAPCEREGNRRKTKTAEKTAISLKK
ncbi:MAG: hypothetical protein L6V86_05415 [Treponema sp.]|nr:MAG: hypothetical protein L6V86_05415 [Treponema sp.]